MAVDQTRKHIRRAKKGDSDAAAALFEQYAGRVFRYMAYRVGDDAEALAGDVFVAMVERIPVYTEDKLPFDAWIHGLAAARVERYWRQRALQAAREAATPGEEIQKTPAIEKGVRARLRELEPDEQNALFYRLVERLSYNEVAAILDKSVSIIKETQYRALRRLSSLLSSEAVAGQFINPRHD